MSTAYASDSLSIGDFISSIKKQFEHDPAMLSNQNISTGAPSFLHNYRTISDIAGNTLYIEAEVHFDSLDTGSDPTEPTLNLIRLYKAPGDCPCHFISQKLGGDGYPRNVYAGNSNLDLTEFQNAQNMVYEHVKKEGNRTAKLFYRITYPDQNADDFYAEEEEVEILFCRPIEIYYQFFLYDENGKIKGEAIEGKFMNEF